MLHKSWGFNGERHPHRDVRKCYCNHINTGSISKDVSCSFTKKKKYFQKQKQSGLNTILFLAVMLVEKCYHSTHSNYQT